MNSCDARRVFTVVFVNSSILSEDDNLVHKDRDKVDKCTNSKNRRIMIDRNTQTL